MSNTSQLNRYRFVLDEFLQRDVSPQSRKRYSRVTIKAEFNEADLPTIEINIRSITDYQIGRGLGGRYLGYNSIRSLDSNGWQYDEVSFNEMMRVRIDHEPTKVLVQRLLCRAKAIVRSFREGTI